MKSVALSGEKRTERGSTNANSLRREEKVPCVIYGGKENVHFTVDEIKFNKIINTPHVYIIDLDIEGTKYRAIIRDVQFHPVTDKTLHIDFLEVFDDKPVTIQVPVRTSGNARGVLNGGKLRIVTKKLRINGLPSALPDEIDVDITNLKIGESINIGDLKLDGLNFVADPSKVVVTVKMSRVVLLEEEVEEEEVDLESMSEEERAEYEKAQAEKAEKGEGEGGDKKPAEGGGAAPAEGDNKPSDGDGGQPADGGGEGAPSE